MNLQDKFKEIMTLQFVKIAFNDFIHAYVPCKIIILKNNR